MNDRSDLPGPDALHIGFSKCASTFLQALFEQHPSIFLVNQSHYFSPFEYSEFPDGREAYLQLFQGADEGQLRLESDEHIVMPLFHPVLKAAATTLDSVAEVCRRIKSVAPDARIVLVIRNQADLIVSRYSEYILGGGKNDFETFLDEFLSCSEDGVNYFQNYYARILEILEAQFAAERVLIILQEELARDERQTLEDLSRFLGIPVQRPERRGMIARRVGLSALGIRVVRRFNRLLVKRQKMSFREAEVRIPFLLYKVLQRALRIADFYLPKRLKGDKNAILTDAARYRLVAEFAADNADLGRKLGRDISALGYPVAGD
jgi:hypothetical protein